MLKKSLKVISFLKQNVIFERAKFNLRNQKENWSVDTFITDLYCRAEYCQFVTLILRTISSEIEL